MPGNHLSLLEQNLFEQWNHNRYNKALHCIRISGANGLRGLTDVEVKFHYPVTVICGQNGAGKTTILSLATLAYHAQVGFHAKGGKNTITQEAGTYYTFQDFFYKGPGDGDFTGVTIEWQFFNHPAKQITKNSNKWMHYERRPKKAVQFLSTARIVSAIEQKGLRSKFKEDAAGFTRAPLDEKHMKYLSQILHRNYMQAEELTIKDSNIRTCNCNREAAYSSFNMGAGEDIIIELLAILQNMPPHSLVVIEEIEIGIHPEALRELAKIIQEISGKKNIQFIISSHSRDFIDSLPRKARILLQRFNDKTHITESPTTSYAMGMLRNAVEPELQILCEDEFAKKILTHAISRTLRKRLHIAPIGSWSELARACCVLRQTSPRSKTLIVWDGDVSDRNASTEISKYHVDNYIFLPGAETPEEYIINTLKGSASAITALTERLHLSSDDETTQILADSTSLGNNHDYFHYIATEVSLHTEQVEDFLICEAIKVCSEEFKKIEEIIASLLNGQRHPDLENHNRAAVSPA